MIQRFLDDTGVMGLVTRGLSSLLGIDLRDKAVAGVLKVLEQLAAEGMTLILVTHEMNFAREVGDRVVFMHQGKVWEQGDSKTLFANPQTTELKQFISSVRGLN